MMMPPRYADDYAAARARGQVWQASYAAAVKRELAKA